MRNVGGHEGRMNTRVGCAAKNCWQFNPMAGVCTAFASVSQGKDPLAELDLQSTLAQYLAKQAACQLLHVCFAPQP